MYRAKIWKHNDLKRIYLNSYGQTAKVWIERDMKNFKIRYRLDNTSKPYHKQFGLPLSLNKQDASPNSIAHRIFEIWEKSQNTRFKSWRHIYNYVSTKGSI